MSDDTRNVTDEFKGMSHDDIVTELDRRGTKLEIAIENTLRDFNMGSIVRSANAFGIRRIHIVGRRQWNKRGAMMTDKYLHVVYHDSFDSLRNYADENMRKIVAIDNVVGAQPMSDVAKSTDSILLFGQEGPGLSEGALATSDMIVAIEQSGSTRSLNVASAAAVAMYQWVMLHKHA